MAKQTKAQLKKAALANEAIATDTIVVQVKAAATEEEAAAYSADDGTTKETTGTTEAADKEAGLGSTEPEAAAAAAQSSAAGWSLRFTATLYTNKSIPLTDGEFMVQYYDLHTNTWAEFMPPSPVIDSNYEAIFPLTQGENPNEELRAKVEGWMTLGAFPLTRLINADTVDSPETTVIGFASIVQPDDVELVITVDYGHRWLTTSTIRHTLEGANELQEYEIGALIRPTDQDLPLYPAIQAALAETDNFASYELGVHTIAVVDPNAGGGTSSGSGDGSGTSLETDLFVLRNQIELQQVELEQLNLRIAARDTMIESQMATTEALQTDIDDKDTQITALQAVVDAGQVAAAPLNEVYTKIVQEVETSSANIADSNYTINNIQLSLKTHVQNGADGIYVQLVDSAAAAASAEGVSDHAISELSFQVGTVKPTAPTTATLAPTVIGLTETATRKRLAEYGLKQRAIYQAVSPTGPHTIGQAFKQIPAAGEEILPNQEVTVIFAKDPNNFN